MERREPTQKALVLAGGGARGSYLYRKMGTFDDIHVEQYEVLDGKDER